MNQYLKILLGNLLLNQGPQDFPHSKLLMRLSLLIYFVTMLPGLMVRLEFEVAVFAAVLDVFMLVLFVYLCLQAFAKSERFIQAVTALACVSFVFQLAIWPLLNILTESPGEEQVAITYLSILGIQAWLLAVYTHIFRESFGVRLPAAMLLTVCYVVINIMAGQILLPEVSSQ